MPLLVGRDDIAAFSTDGNFGFGSGNANRDATPAALAGSATVLHTAFNFGPNSVVRAVLYEQVGGTGPLNEISRIDIPASSAPQATTFPAVNIVDGNSYLPAFWGDVTGTTGGNYTAPIDPNANNRFGEVGSTFGNEPNPFGGLNPELDGQVYWWLEGTAVSTSPTITGDFAPGNQIDIQTSGLGVVTSASVTHATLAGSFDLTIDDTSTADHTLATLPVLISPFSWGQTDLVLTISDGTNTQEVTGLT